MGSNPFPCNFTIFYFLNLYNNNVIPLAQTINIKGLPNIGICLPSVIILTITTNGSIIRIIPIVLGIHTFIQFLPQTTIS